MKKKDSPKRDYVDEYQEWQNNQYNPGHFTGGKVPVWLSHPGRRRLLGTIFIIFGLCYGTWTMYEITQLFQTEAGTGEILSVIFLSIPSIMLLATGIVLMHKAVRR